MLNKRFAFLAGVAAFILLAAAVWNTGSVMPEWSEGVLHPISILPEEGRAQAAAPAPPVVKQAPATPIAEVVKNPVTVGAPGHEENGGSKLVDHYFEQVFSLDKPEPFTFDAMERACAKTQWTEGDVYLKCGAFSAGLTSIMSELKVCFKLAIESGTNLILPVMPLRSTENLKVFNMMNPDAYMGYEEWFDADHLIETLTHACPKMKIVYPSQLDLYGGHEPDTMPVKYTWNIDISQAPGYHLFSSYFWVGRPFKPYFDEKLAAFRLKAFLDKDPNNDKPGVTVVEVAAYFLLYRVTDDPTGEDLKLWTDIAHLNRFRPPIRSLVHQVLAKMKRPYYAVHFRAENDTIWSSPEHQIEVDLQALDDVWAEFGSKDEGAQKPLVYLACGDQKQIEMFVEKGKAKGWEVTHKYALLKEDPGAFDAMTALPFDFQGGVDLGIMLKGSFFMGIAGSAFSSTVANMRDPLGRYRGSSLLNVFDDGARNHLFNDNDAAQYACCL